MKKYRVQMRIKGSPFRPPYEGYVDVWAEDDDDAAVRARRELKRTSFSDVGYDSMQVKSVSRRFSS